MARAALEEDWPRTVAEFQEWHACQPERWEFVEGRPRLMAPASMKHTIIKANLFRALDRALAERGCTVLIDGAQILTDDISAIPDVVVTCVPIDLSTPVVTAPTVIVELMSPSSEADDTLRKWFAYRQTASLKHYLVLAQDRRLVQVHSRAGDLWRERFASEGAIELDDPPLRIEVSALYAATEAAA
ncbi:MAG: Uma2 family endonuclease [Geminicoccaceae bacterium]